MAKALPRRLPFPRTPRRREAMSYRLKVALHKARERNQERREEA